jgi:adenine deaminase
MPRNELEVLADVALGEEKADLVVMDGDIVNVFTGELLNGWSVAIKGDKVAYVGPDARHTIGEQTQVIEAQGRVLVPGFIDGHSHVDLIFTIPQLVKYAILGGTTTIVAETSSIGNSLGYRGILHFIESSQGQPVKFFFTLAPCIPPFPHLESSNPLSPAEQEELLRREEVVGTGEAYWTTVLMDKGRVSGLFAQTKALRKIRDGHAAGAKGLKLAAYAALGATSDHEPISHSEVMERLRLGMHVFVREGNIRRDLENIAAIKDANLDLRRVGLGSDGIGPKELLRDGYQNYMVQKAINLGIDPIKVIQMATLNVAEHFGLDDRVGAIAPGRYADILIIPDLRTIQLEYVICNGVVAARQGQVLVQAKPYRFPEDTRHSIRLPRPFTAEDFKILVKDGRREATVRVMSLRNDIICDEVHMTLPTSNGGLAINVEQDLLKVATVQRHDNSGRFGLGLLRGFGLKRGALAASMGWDAQNIVVVGANEADMALAVNRLAEIQGGVLLAEQGQVLEEMSLPIGGILSELPMETLAEKQERIVRLVKERGCCREDPFLSIQTLSATFLPFLKICERGLVDVHQNQVVSLFLD